MVSLVERSQNHKSLTAVPWKQSLLTGCVSGTTTAFITQPFDVLRTVMQTGTNRPSTMVAAAQNVFSQNGVKGLWRGVVPTFYRVGGGTAVYFYCLNELKFSLGHKHGSPGGGASSQQSSGSRAFASGFVARSAAASVMMPFTIVKTRFEAGDQGQGGVWQNIQKIAMTERGGLTRGALPTILRDAPFSGVYLFGLTKLMAFSHLASDWMPHSVVTFGAGLLAGALATIVTNPPDVVRTRMQLRGSAGGMGDVVQRRGMTAVAMEIVKTDGIGALFTLGLTPRIVKKSFQAAMTWALYQHITDMLALSARAAAQLGPEPLTSSK